MVTDFVHRGFPVKDSEGNVLYTLPGVPNNFIPVAPGAIPKFLGVYATQDEFLLANPTGQVGDFAYIGTLVVTPDGKTILTPTFRIDWYIDQWGFISLTGQPIDLTNLVTTDTEQIIDAIKTYLRQQNFASSRHRDGQTQFLNQELLVNGSRIVNTNADKRMPIDGTIFTSAGSGIINRDDTDNTNNATVGNVKELAEMFRDNQDFEIENVSGVTIPNDALVAIDEQNIEYIYTEVDRNNGGVAKANAGEEMTLAFEWSNALGTRVYPSVCASTSQVLKWNVTDIKDAHFSKTRVSPNGNYWVIFEDYGSQRPNNIIILSLRTGTGAANEVTGAIALNNNGRIDFLRTTGAVLFSGIRNNNCGGGNDNLMLYSSGGSNTAINPVIIIRKRIGNIRVRLAQPGDRDIIGVANGQILDGAIGTISQVKKSNVDTSATPAGTLIWAGVNGGPQLEQGINVVPVGQITKSGINGQYVISVPRFRLLSTLSEDVRVALNTLATITTNSLQVQNPLTESLSGEANYQSQINNEFKEATQTANVLFEIENVSGIDIPENTIVALDEANMQYDYTPIPDNADMVPNIGQEVIIEITDLNGEIRYATLPEGATTGVLLGLTDRSKAININTNTDSGRLNLIGLRDNQRNQYGTIAFNSGGNNFLGQTIQNGKIYCHARTNYSWSGYIGYNPTTNELRLNGNGDQTQGSRLLIRKRLGNTRVRLAQPNEIGIGVTNSLIIDGSKGMVQQNKVVPFDTSNMSIEKPIYIGVDGVPTDDQGINNIPVGVVLTSSPFGTIGISLVRSRLLNNFAKDIQQNTKTLNDLNTNLLQAQDPLVESISGTANTQAEINVENKTEIDSMGTTLNGLKTATLAVSDPIAESISGSATTQADVNVEVAQAAVLVKEDIADIYSVLESIVGSIEGECVTNVDINITQTGVLGNAINSTNSTFTGNPEVIDANGFKVPSVYRGNDLLVATIEFRLAKRRTSGTTSGSLFFRQGSTPTDTFAFSIPQATAADVIYAPTSSSALHPTQGANSALIMAVNINTGMPTDVAVLKAGTKISLKYYPISRAVNINERLEKLEELMK